MFDKQFDASTLITPGLELSKNFSLGHVTSGAFHYVIGKWMPQFGTFLTPGSSSLPNFQVAQSLALGSNNILEKVMKEFGQDMILKSAFTKNGLGNLGQAFDLQIDGYQKNMFRVAEDIKNLAQGADSVELLFGKTSSMRVSYDPKNLINNIVSGKTPSLSSIDSLTGIKENGLTSLRGLF